MTPERNIGGHGQLRTASQGASATSWPVLAQLPRIGGAKTPAAVPTFAEVESARRYDLEIDEGSLGPATTPLASEPRRRYSVDRPHAVRSYDGPAEGSAPTNVEEQRPTSDRPGQFDTPSARHVRIDRGAERRPPAGHAVVAPETLASRAFRVHSALAPHLGLVGAAALILSGGLLYWLAFGQRNATTSSSEVPHPTGGWSSESTLQAEPTDRTDAPTNITANAQSTHNWAAAPHMADATATPTGSSEPSDERLQPASVDEGPALSNPEPSPAASTAPTDGAIDSDSRSAAGTAITPTLSDFPYPFTPYATFPFDGATRVDVAGRPTSPNPLAPR